MLTSLCPLLLFFYVNKRQDSVQIDVIDCTFAGELPDGSYHIDSDSMRSTLRLKTRKNLRIEQYKFASDSKKAVNSKMPGMQLLSFDLKEQQFKNNEIEKNKSENGNENLQQKRDVFGSLAAIVVVVAAFSFISI